VQSYDIRISCREQVQTDAIADEHSLVKNGSVHDLRSRTCGQGRKAWDIDIGHVGRSFRQVDKNARIRLRDTSKP
jgi:hypothetical protein